MPCQPKRTRAAATLGKVAASSSGRVRVRPIDQLVQYDRVPSVSNLVVHHTRGPDGDGRMVSHNV